MAMNLCVTVLVYCLVVLRSRKMVEKIGFVAGGDFDNLQSALGRSLTSWLIVSSSNERTANPSTAYFRV